MNSLNKSNRGEGYPIYLDYNATTPVHPRVASAMYPYLKGKFGNPSSSHPYGVEAEEAVEKARRQVAKLLGTSPGELIFTSGGTESNNYAIRGVARVPEDEGNHIITARIEHPSVLRTCEFLEDQGFEITYLPVDETGRVEVSQVEEAIRQETILVTIMYASNEIGTVQPLPEISELCQGEGILLHTDAAQTVGKIPTEVDELNVDLLTVAGHKLYAPKGIGALYIRDGVKLQKLIHGASQEKGMRSGTENVPEIAGLGEAARLATEDLEEASSHMQETRGRLKEGLSQTGVEVKFNGDPDGGLPNTLSASFKGVEANRFLARIEDQVAASAGAACHSGENEISHVLQAIELPEEWAKGTIRFSTGRMTDSSEIDEAVGVIEEAIAG